MGKTNLVYVLENEKWELLQEIKTAGQTQRASLSADAQWMALG
jgi:hypothetical protein